MTTHDTSTAHTKAPRFANIDALRGISALLVIWLHTAEVFVTLPLVAKHGTSVYDSAELLGVGRMGVVAFFAISGFVIVPTIRGPRTEGTIKFLIKRFFRLFPPYWFAIFGAAISVWWLFNRDLHFLTILANITMIPLELGEPQMMGHFWSLEVELIFYALVLTLFWCRALHRDDVIAWCLVALTILWPILFKSKLGRSIVNHNEVWTFLSYFLSVMFWGSMLRRRTDSARSARSPLKWKDHWPLIITTILVFGRPLIAITLGSPTVNREDWRGTLLGLILFWTMITLPRGFGSSLTWLGSISYSLYLLHPIVFYSIYYFTLTNEESSSAPLFVFVVISISGTVMLAGLSYNCIERPSNAIARAWVARRNVLANSVHKVET